MNKNSSASPAETPRILLACNTESETAYAHSELEKLELEVHTVSEKDPFLEALQRRPDLVVANHRFGGDSLLKSARECHPQISFILIYETDFEDADWNKGINVCIPKKDLARLSVWVEILLALKAIHAGNDIEPNILEGIWSAISHRTEAIYSPSLDQLRLEARRHAKTPEERLEALRTWTKEMEQKKVLAAAAESARHKEDLLISSTPRSETEFMSPALGSPGKPTLDELRQIQIDLAAQIAQVTAELKEIRQQLRS